MDFSKRRRVLLAVFSIMILAVLICSCGPKARPPVGEMDTPQHHVNVGMKFLEQGNFAGAVTEFDLAISLDPKFSRAYTGKGLALAYQNDMKTASELLSKGWKYAETDQEKVFYHVAKIRYFTLLKKEDSKWLKHARGEFDDALKLEPKSSAAHYFMGKAYKTAYQFETARDMYRKVIDFNDKYTKEANEEWRLMDKIQRAMPGTENGKRIALVESISRADAAALFMEELKLDELYKKRTPASFKTDFVDPEKAVKAKAEKPKLPEDIVSHPLKSDIEGVLKLGIPGLEVSGGKFYPDDKIRKGEYALMIVDILMKITGDNSLATRNFEDKTSKFKDMRTDQAFYSSSLLLVTKGIMEMRDPMRDEFAPLDTMNGADALLVIRKMKDEYKIY